MSRHATPTVPKEHENRLARFPCAGPYASISGMKKLFWGEDAYCVKCGVYLYKVDKATWERY